jgi:hypothetical protein
MPTKASITTRTGKGSPLTTAEMDNNLTNLRDQSIGIADDGSTVISIDSGNTLTVAGATNISTAVSGSTLTITGPDISSFITASSADNLTNKTGNISQWTNDSGYLTTETNDLSSAVTWANVPDVNITQSSVTQHQAALSITESQISDLQSYLTSETFTSLAQDTTPQLGGSLDVNGQSIVSVSNGNIVLAPNGTGQTKINNINYSEAAPYTVIYGATITPDVANGNIQKVTLTGNVTFSAFSNPVAGQTLTLFVVQDATGSRTLTSSMLFAGGSKILSTAANAIDIITVHYDGTTYYANLVTNFS